MLTIHSLPAAGYRAGSALLAATLAAALAACDLPFGVGTPTTRGLERGVADGLASADNLELRGSYTGGGNHWTVDLQLSRPRSEHITVTSSSLKLEAIIVGNDAFYRGHDYLAAHMGSDPVSRGFVRSAGNGWWKAAAGHVPQLTDLTDGAIFNSTFLGQTVTRRTDNVSVDGQDAVELSGPRADVFIGTDDWRVLRVRFKHGVVIDGIKDADLEYHYDGAFKIEAPRDVIDFSNLSTLPPIYTVLSVDTSACASACTVAALLKNLGGMVGAPAPSVVTFTMTDNASRQTVGSCQAQVRPDVGYNATTTVTCAIDNAGSQPSNAATVTARADNPGSG